MKDLHTPARSYLPGIGQAVADRTINRKIERPLATPKAINFSIPRDDITSLDAQIAALAKSEGYVCEGDYHVEFGDDAVVQGFYWATAKIETETWEDVAQRVALGNAMLHPEVPTDHVVKGFRLAGDTRLTYGQGFEYDRMHHHLRQASILMSGRHLQHGDKTQKDRNLEVFTNCSSAAMSTILFKLLLSGSGVGRSYDDDLMVVDYNQMPIVVCTIDWGHANVKSGEIAGCLTQRDADHLYAGRERINFRVPDSREGWAKAVEQIEKLAFLRKRESVLILDFSDVRPKGAPIKGMQNRPASGPGPLMKAIQNVAQLRDAGMDAWRATMYADHYLAECVLVGGARRAARMATKRWDDDTIFDFINLKRGGFLWSSNNSVMIDQDFRKRVTKVNWWVKDHPMFEADIEKFFHLHGFSARDLHAWKVMNAILRAGYDDQTGEPGLINADKLTQKDVGYEVYDDGVFAESKLFTLDDETKDLGKEILARVKRMRYKMITNPCGEITLLVVGGYCVIADVVPFHAQDDDDAEDAFRTATRALIRTNLMDSLYNKEVKRTNRIGVGITGLHEWIFARFGFGWHDILNEKLSKPMWLTLSRFKRAVVHEAQQYATELGVTVPHTNTTIKPAGTTSKLFGLTEGAHLPALREYLRWVQYRNDDPLVPKLEAQGYPVRHLNTYSGTTIVGFPTAPVICRLGMGDKLVTAPEATPEEQFQYLRLLEKYWIVGVEEDGVTPLAESGNQVSYTLKFDPKKVDFKEFRDSIINGQFSVRCASVMPSGDMSAYEYLPEEPVTKDRYEHILAAIKEDADEDVDFAHVDCAGGACPVSFDKEEINAPRRAA